MRNLLASVFMVSIGLNPLVAFGQEGIAGRCAGHSACPAGACAGHSAPAAVARRGSCAPATPAQPTDRIHLGALVDAYYMYNFTGNPSTQGPGASSVRYRG